jgi:hypothetical protein
VVLTLTGIGLFLYPDRIDQPGPANSPSAQRANIDSTQDWQATGVTAQAGDKLTINYITGTWSNCADVGCPFVDANGISARDLNSEDNILKNCNHAALIAKIGNSLYCVASSFSFVSSDSGPVLLRINDMQPQDNEGEITVDVNLNN